ncbi:MAG: DUF4900 domain-containing protein [Candidatus Omnitrophica bacterium]|nr:DUF4900 domain-containing protein [Candidatus Omnitrophota bacterium]
MLKQTPASHFRQRGVAMVLALMIVVNLGILEAAFISRTISGIQMSAVEKEHTKALYATIGGSNLALKMVNTLINGYLQTTILSASPSGVASDAKARVNSGDGIGWLVNAVRLNNTAVLTLNGEEASYAASGSVGGVPYAYTITFTEKSDPVTITADKWDFPFAFRIECTGTQGTLKNKIATSGDFTVRVQKDNFAKFALYTNFQETPGGLQVWFTNRAAFYGPVHTNDRFNFAYNPAGTFGGLVTQAQSTARFYNNNNPVLSNNNANGNIDVPVFQNGFNRGVTPITLTAATAESAMVTEAKNNNNYNNNGIYLPANGNALSGGIYVKGDSTISLSVNAQDNAVYTITQGASTRVVTVNAAANQTTLYNSAANTTTTYTGVPTGASKAGTLIYVNGNITSLAGTVQRDTELTVASSNDITITNNIRYSDYSPGSGTPGNANYVPPSASAATNLLGIVSWNGDVNIANTAPDNIDIHGTIMAQSGVFQVDSYDNGDIKGVATLLGGVITNDYGAFGQFNSTTGATVSGYGRNFIYDERMQAGSAPPYFPSLATFIAFTNDITDKLVWQGMN